MSNAEDRRAFSSAWPVIPPLTITKIGHLVLNCRDLMRPACFYIQMLGFKVSGVYPTTIVPGGMVFMRYDFDHRGVALVESMTGPSPNFALNRSVFQVESLDEVIPARDSDNKGIKYAESYDAAFPHAMESLA